MKRNIYFFLFFVFLGFNVAAKEWTLAASPFEVLTDDESLKSLSVSIPEMITRSLKSELMREVSENELHQRRLSALHFARLDLLLRLRQTAKERDSALLTLSGISAKSKIRECERKIAKIKKELKKNLAEQKKAEGENADESSKGSGKKKKEIKENVVLYKSGDSCIFYPSKKALADDSKTVLQKELESAGIEGLVVGSLDYLSGFVVASVKVYSYPAAVVLAQASDIADISDARALASRLSSSLLPRVLSSFPALLNFTGENENISMKMDGTFYEKIPKKLEVSSGVHFMEFTSSNFKSASLLHHFEGNCKYDVSLNLKPAAKRFLRIKSDNFFTSKMFASSPFTHENETDGAEISFNGESVTALFLAKDGRRLWYFIDAEKAKDAKTYEISEDLVDVKKLLQNRRHSMYFAYSIFISSLIPTFYCAGNYGAALMATQEGRAVKESELLSWQIGNYTCAGISVASAIYLAVELVRYFRSAEKVLPVSSFQDEKIRK